MRKCPIFLSLVGLKGFSGLVVVCGLAVVGRGLAVGENRHFSVSDREKLLNFLKRNSSSLLPFSSAFALFAGRDRSRSGEGKRCFFLPSLACPASAEAQNSNDDGLESEDLLPLWSVGLLPSLEQAWKPPTAPRSSLENVRLSSGLIQHFLLPARHSTNWMSLIGERYLRVRYLPSMMELQ